MTSASTPYQNTEEMKLLQRKPNINKETNSKKRDDVFFMHIVGRYQGRDWYWKNSELEKNNYKMKEYVYEYANVIGAQGIDGHIIVVMNDERFDENYREIISVEDEVHQLLLFNFPKSNAKIACAELKNIECKKPNQAFVSADGYEIIKKFNFFNIIYLFSIMIVMIFSCMIVIMIDALSNENVLLRKYSLLVKQGIREKDLRKLVRSDIRFVPVFGMLISLIASFVLYNGWVSFLYNMKSYNNDYDGMTYLYTTVVYVVLYLIITEVFVRCFDRRIVKQLL